MIFLFWIIFKRIETSKFIILEYLKNQNWIGSLEKIQKKFQH